MKQAQEHPPLTPVLLYTLKRHAGVESWLIKVIIFIAFGREKLALALYHTINLCNSKDVPQNRNCSRVQHYRKGGFDR
jgi:hypothetical protein